MKEPTFDADGYPTDETLEAIRMWDEHDLPGLFAFIEKAWKYPEYFNRQDNQYTISTGGWSGNEQIIGVLRNNTIAWMLSWVSSRRGGHYEFELPKGTK